MPGDRLAQWRGPDGQRAVILARNDQAHLVSGVATVRELATLAIGKGRTLLDAALELGLEAPVDLGVEFALGRLIAPIDHADPAHLTLSGTGLTHLGSAEGRDAMHRAAASGSNLTDSMRIFLEGLEGGKPPAGQVGQQPEWFYKGDGTNLRGPGEDLEMPSFALDGGEEPELAGIYMIGPDGQPFRLGLCLANEFSDHRTERHNYLWLAHSKLRTAAIGPELSLGQPPTHVAGTSRIVRDGTELWSRTFVTGEDNMSHSLDNLEAHHFKYAQFRQPGDIHVHFFGTATLSFSDGIETRPGDVFEISADAFALPLRNRMIREDSQTVAVRSL